jgi:hypothetical protein
MATIKVVRSDMLAPLCRSGVVVVRVKNAVMLRVNVPPSEILNARSARPAWIIAPPAVRR